MRASFIRKFARRDNQRSADLIVSPPETAYQDPEENVSPPPANANASGRSLVRNALAGYISTFVSMASGFLVTPILVRQLGSNAYGTWILLYGIMGYFGQLEFGIGTATAKRVAECRATKDRARLEETLGTAFGFFALFCAILFMLGLVIVLFGLPHLHIAPENRTAAAWCLTILLINQATAFLFNTNMAVLFGAGRLDLMVVANVCIAAATAILQCVLVYMKVGIVGLACVTLLSTITISLMIQRTISREFPDVRVRPRAATWNMARELAKFGSRNGIIYISLSLGFSMDTLIIGAMLPVASVANYAIAAKLTSLVRIVASKPCDVVLPAYAHHHAMDNKARQFKLYVESTTLSLCLALPCLIAMCAFGESIIRFWVGAGHSQSYPILIALALMSALSIAGISSLIIVTAKEKNELLIKIAVCTAIANILLSIFFTHLFGAIGPALGSLCVVGIPELVLLPTFICRELGFSYRQYITQTLGTLALPIAVTTLSSLLFRKLFVAPGVGTLLVEVVFTLAAFWSVWLVFGIKNARRHAYFGGLRSLLDRKRKSTEAV